MPPRQIANPVGYRGSLKERFEAKYVPEPNSGCWLWIAAVNPQGYGVISLPGKLGQAKMSIASRVSWELAKGTIPSGLYALHRCDTPACVNPDHLFLGSLLDNAQDALRKGRASKPPIAKKGQGLQELCLHGHALTGDNLYLGKYGHRACRECNKLYKRLRRAAGLTN